MENFKNGSLEKPRSVFLLKSERNVQTIIGGEIVTISEGDSLSMIVTKFSPVTNSVVGLFSSGEHAIALECGHLSYLNLISELTLLTSKN